MMPTCQNCGQQWSWFTTVKKMFTLKKKMMCPNCQTGQYVTSDTLQKTGMVSMIPLFTWVPLSSFGVPLLISAAVVIIVVLIVFALMPKLYKLSNEEDPLW
ncbi:TIGR04104 family putative zinc finger protein [Cytobacillus horneckiae]|uniref:TIGR04104 family putative zinc finger protein n=1 Tax=Cytobacillus horneckiae TaxID=549687 RepID=UPI00203ACC18|nr:TIGR04104 family putative zinc finger protein [Cytobacillus horneckiae]